MKQLDVLETVAWGEKHFGSVITGGGLLLRDVRRAIRDGLIVSAGQVIVCDGDGFGLEPERYREGFKLTDAGRAVVAEAKALARLAEGV